MYRLKADKQLTTVWFLFVYFGFVVIMSHFVLGKQTEPVSFRNTEIRPHPSGNVTLVPAGPSGSLITDGLRRY